MRSDTMQPERFRISDAWLGLRSKPLKKSRNRPSPDFSKIREADVHDRGPQLRGRPAACPPTVSFGGIADILRLPPACPLWGICGRRAFGKTFFEDRCEVGR